MTVIADQTVRPVISEQLRKRLESVGASVIAVDSDGRAYPSETCRWIERLLIGSSLFKSIVKRIWPVLSESPGKMVELWPGFWLVPLPADRRRLVALNRKSMRITALLVLGSELLGCEQLNAVFSEAQVDVTAGLARIEANRFVSSAEAQRMGMIVTWMHEDGLEINRRREELRCLSQQLAQSYEEISLLYRLSADLSVDQPPETFLTDSCKELQQVVGLKWLSLMLIDDKPGLNELAGRVFVTGPVGCDAQQLKRIGQMVMEKQPAGDAPWIIDDTTSLPIPGISRLAKQLLVVTLRHNDRPIGVLFGGDKIDGEPINSGDSKLCNSLANSLSMFLENLILYEDIQAMFMGTLHALTSSIDAKDRYTRGHSERVAVFSKQLAVAAGLEPQIVERVYISGLIHDLGKIGVPESVLCKHGRLNEDEFKLMKMHPEIGARILQDITQMRDLIPGVLYHHERWDGRGYPHQLAGKDIPLFGRLICLADSFDAMCSNRTYRSSVMSLEQAQKEIRRCSGSQFDPELTEAFLSQDLRPMLDMIQKEQGAFENTAVTVDEETSLSNHKSGGVER